MSEDGARYDRVTVQVAATAIVVTVLGVAIVGAGAVSNYDSLILFGTMTAAGGAFTFLLASAVEVMPGV